MSYEKQYDNIFEHTEPYIRSQLITEVITIHPLETMNVRSKLHGNLIVIELCQSGLKNMSSLKYIIYGYTFSLFSPNDCQCLIYLYLPLYCT